MENDSKELILNQQIEDILAPAQLKFVFLLSTLLQGCSVVTCVVVVCSPVLYYYSFIISYVLSPCVIKPCNASTCVS